MSWTIKTFRTQDAINTVASEMTLHRLDLLAMGLYVVPYISPKLVGKHNCTMHCYEYSMLFCFLLSLCEIMLKKKH
jgi:hypothetical protein